jgi:hypothetical protein
MAALPERFLLRSNSIVPRLPVGIGVLTSDVSVVGGCLAEQFPVSLTHASPPSRILQAMTRPQRRIDELPIGGRIRSGAVRRPFPGGTLDEIASCERAGGSLFSSERHRRHQRILCLPRIKTCVLDDDRRVGRDDAGKVRPTGNRLRVGEVVEADMTGPSRRDRQSIRSNRIPIRIEDRNFDIGLLIRSIEDARFRGSSSRAQGRYSPSGYTLPQSPTGGGRSRAS